MLEECGNYSKEIEKVSIKLCNSIKNFSLAKLTQKVVNEVHMDAFLLGLSRKIT